MVHMLLGAIQSQQNCDIMNFVRHPTYWSKCHEVTIQLGRKSTSSSMSTGPPLTKDNWSHT